MTSLIARQQQNRASRGGQESSRRARQLPMLELACRRWARRPGM